MFRKLIYIFLGITFFTFEVGAQEQRNLNKEVKVQTAYQPKINKAKRIGELPEIVDTLRFTPTFDYLIQTNPIAVRFSPSLISAAQMIGEPLQKLNSNSLTLAGGNYSNIFGDYRYNNKRSKEIDYGLHLHHYSTSGKVTLDDKRDSKPNWSEQLAEIYGTKYLESASVSAHLSYNRKSYKYYGLPLKIDDGKIWKNLTDYDSQLINRIGLEANYATNFQNEQELNYGVGLKYENFSDDIEAKANDITLNGFAKMQRGIGLWSLKTKLNYFMSDGLLDRDSQNKTSRNSFVGTLNPTYSFKKGKVNVKLGLKGVFAFGDDSETQFYPDINVTFEAIEDILHVYAGVDGDLKMNQYKDLVAENPYVVSGLNPTPTSVMYRAYGGVKGSLSSNSSFNASLAYSSIKDQYFYTQIGQIQHQYTINYSNKFNVVSDDISLLRFMAEFDFSEIERLNIYSKLVYNLYSLDKQAEAWHLPNIELSIEGKYKILEDLKVTANFDVLGERYVLQNQVKKSLDAVYNLSLGASYSLLDNFTVFAKACNIFADRYYRWDQYPSQRFNFLVGLKAVF
jgi:hypothetical protein